MKIKLLLGFGWFWRPNRTLAVLVALAVGVVLWNQYPQPRKTVQFSPGSLISVYFTPARSFFHFAPDGKTLAILHFQPLIVNGLAVASNNCQIQLWDVVRGREKLVLPVEDLARIVAFRSDGQFLAGVSLHKETIWLWDTITGKQKASYQRKEWSQTIHLAFSPQGKLLALDNGYRLWDVAEAKILADLQPPCIWPWNPNNKSTKTMGMSPDFLALWHEETVKLFHLPTGALTMEIPKFGDWKGHWLVDLNPLTPDGKVIGSYPEKAPGQKQGSLFVYDLVRKEVQEFKENEAWQIALSPDGKTMAATIVPLFLQENYFTHYARNPEGFWSWLPDWAPGRKLPKTHVKLIDVSSGEALAILDNCAWPVFSPDGKTMVAMRADDGFLQFWDLPLRRPLGKIFAFSVLAFFLTLMVLKGIGCLRLGRRLAANPPSSQ
jgi:WD40 repeat protein